jgi:hypothetical protein
VTTATVDEARHRVGRPISAIVILTGLGTPPAPFFSRTEKPALTYVRSVAQHRGRHGVRHPHARMGGEQGDVAPADGSLDQTLSSVDAMSMPEDRKLLRDTPAR